MDIEKIEERLTPSKRVSKSRLGPYLTQILMLRSKGYALNQICDLLKQDGITISIPGLSTYIQRHENKPIQKEAVPLVKKVGEVQGAKLGDKPKTFKHDPSPDKDELL
jgi:hypothetical protein